jgi:hypothetical protein
MHEKLMEASRSPAFTESPSPYLLLDLTFRICAANDAFLRASGQRRDALEGKLLFDAVPDLPDGLAAVGVRIIQTSLQYVLRWTCPGGLAIDSSKSGVDANPTASWDPLNAPIIDDERCIVGIWHHADDVSRLARLTVGTPNRRLQDSLRDQLQTLLLLASEAQRSQAMFIRENERLGRALSALMASAPGGVGGDAERRREVWEGIAGQGGAANWRGWAHAVCRAAVGTQPGASAAATLRFGGLRQLVAATEAWTERLEDLDHALGEGPVTSAYNSGAPVVALDLDAEHQRWPAFCREGAALGLGGVSAWPLQTHAGAIGTLSLYYGSSSRPKVGAEDMSVLADLLVTVLLTDMDSLTVGAPIPAADSVTGQLRNATGMVGAQLHVGMDEALSLIRAHAFATGQTLSAVAQEVIRGDLRL